MVTKDILVEKSDAFIHKVYKISRKFPKEELFGVTSQLRRAALSIILNIIEGFARQRSQEYIRFLEIAYGSLKETKYLLYFSYKENYLSKDEYKKIINIGEEIGKMLWSRMNKLKSDKNNVKC